MSNVLKFTGTYIDHKEDDKLAEELTRKAYLEYTGPLIEINLRVSHQNPLISMCESEIPWNVE